MCEAKASLQMAKIMERVPALELIENAVDASLDIQAMVANETDTQYCIGELELDGNKALIPLGPDMIGGFYSEQWMPGDTLVLFTQKTGRVASREITSSHVFTRLLFIGWLCSYDQYSIEVHRDGTPLPLKGAIYSFQALQKHHPELLRHVYADGLYYSYGLLSYKKHSEVDFSIYDRCFDRVREKYERACATKIQRTWMRHHYGPTLASRLIRLMRA